MTLVTLDKNTTVERPDSYNILNSLGLTNLQFHKVMNPVSNGREQNRYQIEVSDNSRPGFRECIARTKQVSQNFSLVQPQKIQEVVERMLENDNLGIVRANNYNYGEKVDIQFAYKKVFPNNIPGIGVIQPHLYVSIPVWGGINFVTTLVQLACTNQIPSLASDPSSKFVTLTHSGDVEKKLDKIAVEMDGVEEFVEGMVERLSTFSTFSIDDDEFELFARRLYKIPEDKASKQKSRVLNRLKTCYTEAPNALPGNLLGAMNAVTRYYQTKPYRRSNSFLAGLPQSEGYNKSRKALKMCSNIAKFGMEYLD